MANIDLTLNETEIAIILEALDQNIKSSKRAQNTTKNPVIKQVWETHEQVALTLLNKIKTTPPVIHKNK